MTKDWLGISDIAEKLEGHLDAEMIQLFHENATIREMLGANEGEYPSWSLRYWKLVAEATCDGLSPEEAGVFIRSLMDRESRFAEDMEASHDGEGEAEDEPTGIVGLTYGTVRAFAESFASALVHHARKEGLFPPREDRLIDKTEAARLLNCSEQAVGRRVRAIQPGSWSYIQIQDYLARLRGEKQ